MRSGATGCVIAGLMCVLAIKAGSSTTQAPPVSMSPSLALPDGEGKALVERVCTGCHDPSLVMFRREDEDGWAVIVQDMAARGAKGTEESARRIFTKEVGCFV